MPPIKMTPDEKQIVKEAHEHIEANADKRGDGPSAYDPEIHSDEFAWAIGVLDDYDIEALSAYEESWEY